MQLLNFSASNLNLKDDKDKTYKIYDDKLERLLNDGTRLEIAPCPPGELGPVLEEAFYKVPTGRTFKVKFSNEGVYIFLMECQ